jgi:REP element-mobilizing transposase RayT
MPRLPRLHAPGAIYHVTARGNHRQDIFFRRTDRQALDEIMAHALQRTGARVHAYCWMTNHLHLLVQVGILPLGVLMQRVCTRFARFIQKNMSTTGHLFENRYQALLVDADSYFLELLRYMHLNPVRAGIVDSPDSYLWSSHRTYLGKAVQPWVHTDFALSLFSNELSRARVLYEQFVNEQVGRPCTIELKGHPDDPRVLGDDRFLQQLGIPVLFRYPSVTLEQLADRICMECGVTLESLRSPRRQRTLCRIRAQLAQRALAEHAASLSQVARFLNRSASALARAIERYSA